MRIILWLWLLTVICLNVDNVNAEKRSGALTSKSEPTRIESLVMSCHLLTAQALSVSTFHLQIKSLTLGYRQEFHNKYCKSPDDCQLIEPRLWTGTVNLMESTRLFSNQKTYVSDVMLLAEHKGSVHVRCGNQSLVHLTKPLSRKVPYLIYVLPSSIVRECGSPLQIHLTQSKQHFKKKSYDGIKLQVIINFSPVDGHQGAANSADTLFISRFRQSLLNATLDISDSREWSTTERAAISDDKLPDHRDSLTTRDVKRSLSNMPGYCRLVRESLNERELHSWIEAKTNETISFPLTSLVDFQYCTGMCAGISKLHDHTTRPLVEQSVHQDFYWTMMKLKSLNIIDLFPTTECIGYNYIVFQVSYMSLAMSVNQIYIQYPQSCACV